MHFVRFVYEKCHSGLEISLITVKYKRIGKFWYITQSELNSCKLRYFH
jgi:hypothetical protein